MNTIESVREFHEAFDIPVRAKPSFPARVPLSAGIVFVAAELRRAQREANCAAQTGCRMSLRLALECEELAELAEAMASGNVAAALDAQVDRRYIADGTTLELGMAEVFHEAFSRVHGANMRKLGPDGNPIVDERGKVRKPEGWTAADLSDLIV